MAVSFGAKMLKNPTPTNIVWWIRVYTAVACAVMGWMPTVSFISHNFQDISTSILGLTTTIANVMLPFFGVQNNGQEKVDIKDVSAMDDTKQDT